MSSLERATSLANVGLFLDALRILDVGSIGRENKTDADVLRADLLERTGNHRDAAKLIDAILKSRTLREIDRWSCYLTLGRIAAEEGRFDVAAGHLQRSIRIALLEKDFARAAWPQLRLLIILFDASGQEAVGPLVSDLRANAARSGDPLVLAALHIHIGEMETKRGRLSSAYRQIGLAHKTLETSPNAWLQAMAEQNLANLACLRLNFESGIGHAEAAARLAEKAGWAAGCAASAATLGNLYFYSGRFEEAAACSSRALNGFTKGSDNFSGTLETLARIRLAQGRLEDCDDALRQIEEYSSSEGTRRRFVYRHTLLTKARAFHLREFDAQAEESLDEAIRLASDTRDDWLLSSARLAKAELLAGTRNPGEMLPIFDALTSQIATQPLDRHAALEKALACGLMATGDFQAAREHVTRARTIYEAVDHRLGLLELSNNSTLSGAVHSVKYGCAEVTDVDSAIFAKRGILQNVSACINHVGHPKLLARELLDVAATSGSIECGRALYHPAHAEDEIIADYKSDNLSESRLVRRIVVGTDQSGHVELILYPKPDIESLATISALLMLLTTLHELEASRIEREERATIWPADDVAAGDDNAILSGHLREIMALAQRVARTRVNVLITGESGTGKEIIARAIHNYSPRATKPFVPFNCAAVPRDLVESHLFGHRRGAFTGADRDYAGLIRSARDGTLFLDEIGDLSLDLQPKLLRFLESGEIAPLGEPGSFNVDVRIVAATNTKLEEAVRDGRFREDLFYRLNVVRLSLKPLRERRDEIPGMVTTFVARAAREFSKGRLEIAEETMERLLLYRWPGNVRQLMNELRRMVALAEPNSTLGPTMISADILDAMPIFQTKSPNEIAVRLTEKLMPTLAHVECEMIKAAIRDHHGRVDAVAKALGISRKGLYLKRQRLGL
jgi:DNA-binding NtrC family response regulator/tetratricopeptide (TPR) repeat protein